jgi:ATP-dependent exoDNAse (exonuclease V) beta subunit
LVGAYVAPEEGEGITREKTMAEVKWPSSAEKPLYQPIVSAAGEEIDAGLDEEPARDWRATGARISPPAPVVGLLVHRALEDWLFPGDEGLEMLLETAALREGLVDPRQCKGAIRAARRLLARLRAHPLWTEIDGADERHHEVAYAYPSPSGRPEYGVIDLLYRAGEGWMLIDFKIDDIGDGEMLAEAIERHSPQIQRYARAARSLLGASVQAELCFLDYMGEVRVESV